MYNGNGKGVVALNPRKLAEAALKESGMVLYRRGANHDLFIDPVSGEFIPLSRSSHFNDNDLRGVRREIGKIKAMREKNGRK